MKTMLAARYVLEVQSGYEKRVMQLLAKAGAQEVINAGMGYLYMTGTSDLMGQVKTWRGVRAVLPAEGEALPPLRHSTKQRDLLEPCTNLRYAARILRESIDRHGYNWTAIERYNGINPKYPWKIHQALKEIPQ